MLDIFTKAGFIQFLYFLPALLISLSIHEFGHAITAYKFGDKSQKARNRLTLAPFSHIDWMGFLAIILFGFGWGKPVLVDDRNFKKKNRDNMLVALAGPLSNIFLAIFFTIVIKVLFMFDINNETITGTVGKMLYAMLTNAISFNIVFAAFNLIPLPPFDGSKVLYFFLPHKAKDFMNLLERYSLFIVLVLVITDLYMYIMMPIYTGVAWIINLILMI